MNCTVNDACGVIISGGRCAGAIFSQQDWGDLQRQKATHEAVSCFLNSLSGSSELVGPLPCSLYLCGPSCMSLSFRVAGSLRVFSVVEMTLRSLNVSALETQCTKKTSATLQRKCGSSVHVHKTLAHVRRSQTRSGVLSVPVRLTRSCTRYLIYRVGSAEN